MRQWCRKAVLWGLIISFWAGNPGLVFAEEKTAMPLDTERKLDPGPAVSADQAEAQMKQDADDLQKAKAILKQVEQSIPTGTATLAVMQPAEQPPAQTLQWVPDGKEPEIVLLADKGKKTVPVTELDQDGFGVPVDKPIPKPPFPFPNTGPTGWPGPAGNMVTNPSSVTIQLGKDGKPISYTYFGPNGNVTFNIQTGQITINFNNGSSATLIWNQAGGFYWWQFAGGTINYSGNGQNYGISTFWYNPQNGYWYAIPSDPNVAGQGYFYIDPNKPGVYQWYQPAPRPPTQAELDAAQKQVEAMIWLIGLKLGYTAQQIQDFINQLREQQKKQQQQGR